MTLLVRISHANPGYPKSAIVQVVNDEGKAAGARHVLHEKEFCDVYVYPGCSLHVSEGPERPGLAVVSEGHAAASGFGALEGSEHVDIPVGESQTISPGDVGHVSSLFAPLGTGR